MKNFFKTIIVFLISILIYSCNKNTTNEDILSDKHLEFPIIQCRVIDSTHAELKWQYIQNASYFKIYLYNDTIPGKNPKEYSTGDTSFVIDSLQFSKKYLARISARDTTLQFAPSEGKVIISMELK